MGQIHTKTILVIEGNPANLKLFEDILCHSKFRVLKAQDGKEGLYAAQQYVPDLIIIDQELARISGEDLAKRLKGDPLLRKIPLIAITPANAILKGDVSDFEGFLSKPFTVKKLLRIVTDTINMQASAPFSNMNVTPHKKVIH